MIDLKEKLQWEDLCVALNGRAKQQKVFCFLDTIVRRAHWVYGIPKIVLEYLKI